MSAISALRTNDNLVIGGVDYSGNKYNKGDIVRVDEIQSDLLLVSGKLEFSEAKSNNPFVLHFKLYNCA